MAAVIAADCRSKSKHGTASAYYNHQCRCPAAREAWRLYTKRRREGRQLPGYVDATGTIRRLQALAVMGWPHGLIAREAFGWADDGHVTLSKLYGAKRFTRTTADRLAVFYETHSMTFGPSRRTRTRALARGFVPPLAWDDIDDVGEQPKGVAA